MGAEDDFRARDIGRDHLKRVAAAEFRGARATRFGARRTVRSARTRIEKKRRKKSSARRATMSYPAASDPPWPRRLETREGRQPIPCRPYRFLKTHVGVKPVSKAPFDTRGMRFCHPRAVLATRGKRRCGPPSRCRATAAHSGVSPSCAKTALGWQNLIPLVSKRIHLPQQIRQALLAGKVDDDGSSPSKLPRG